MARQNASRRFPFSARQVAGLVLLVVAVIFILENRVTTTVRFLVPRVSTPLWVALLVSALAGVIAGALLTYRHDRD
ncbi:MAG: LapA family protein [Actinomycetota bacterium]|nr:LapA family protein [Actinomycetota bacterium]